MLAPQRPLLSKPRNGDARPNLASLHPSDGGVGQLMSALWCWKWRFSMLIVGLPQRLNRCGTLLHDTVAGHSYLTSFPETLVGYPYLTHLVHIGQPLALVVSDDANKQVGGQRDA